MNSLKRDGSSNFQLTLAISSEHKRFLTFKLPSLKNNPIACCLVNLLVGKCNMFAPWDCLKFPFPL